MFYTLPITEGLLKGGAPLRLVLSHDSRADATAPAEADVRALLESVVAFRPTISLATMEKKTSFPAEKPLERVLSPLADRTDVPVHMTVHLGGFLSVESIMKTQALHMMDVLARDDSAPNSWLPILEETEAKLRMAYRKALNASSVRRVMSRAGNIFLCGQGEIGGASIMMMCSPRPSAANKHKSYEEMNISGGWGESGSSTVVSSVLAARDRLMMEAEDRSAAQEELRELAMAALLRVARHVYWIYMRQGWQESRSFESMIRADVSDEEMQRAVSRHIILTHSVEITNYKSLLLPLLLGIGIV